MDLSNLPTTLTSPTKAAPQDGIKIYTNGVIITMAGGTFSQVEALVVTGDTITYTGDAAGAQKSAGPGAETIDLRNKCLLPGFIEPHVHLIMTTMVNNFMLKLSPMEVTTLEEAIKVIAGAIPNNLLNGWVAGFGYDPSRVKGHPNLTVEILDAISTKYPIYIINQSGHIGYVNSVTLALAGVTAANADSSYQKINGKLTGVIYELAVGQIGKLMPSISPEKIILDCRKTLDTWASLGCTTIFDAGIGSVSPKDGELLTIATALPPPVRYYGAIAVYAYPMGKQLTPPIKFGHVEAQAIKCWADGSTQGFTAAEKKPYFTLPVDMPANGTLNYTDEAFYKDMAPHIQNGFQIIVHSNGDRATEQTLNVYEAALKAYPNVPHAGMHRIEHFTVTEPEQLARAKNLGLAISHTIGHVNFWGNTFKTYVLGPERAERIDPLKSDEEAGLIWSLHSDSPITDVNPLLYLRTATTRLLYPDGGVLGKHECVDLEAALRGITVNPAKQIGIESTVGSLEVGKKADFVVLNRDPRITPLPDLDKLVVEQTWMGGRLTYTKTSS
jgi:predicted amidohydrolase YtcJ